MKNRIQFELKDYIKLEMIGLSRTSFQDTCSTHKHPFWELVYSVSGEGIHQIGNQEITLHQGEFCLIPPDLAHSCKNIQSAENTKLYIGFSFSVYFCAEDPEGPVIFTDESPVTEILQLELRTLSEYLQRNSASLTFLHTDSLIAALVQLVGSLADNQQNHTNLDELRDQNIVEKIKDYLHLNINRPVRVDELASMFYLSPYYISDLFRKSTGIGIKRYHENLRMCYALQRLKDHKCTVTEVAEELGFDNIHYFSRRFKLHFSFPPSQVLHSEFQL